MNPNFGDTPYIRRGFQVDPKRLFASDEANALKLMRTLVPGYGILEAGTVVGRISESTNRLGMYVPYPVAAPVAGLPFIAGAYLLADGGGADTTADITIPDSYKFAVGDHIAGVDSAGNPLDIGAITAIDRTTFAHYATITFAQIDLSTLTVANGAMIHLQTAIADPFAQARGVLGEGVDTGVGADAAGGQGAVFFSNVMFYSGLLPNLDAAAIVDMGAVADGQQLILR